MSESQGILGSGGLGGFGLGGAEEAAGEFTQRLEASLTFTGSVNNRATTHGLSAEAMLAAAMTNQSTHGFAALLTPEGKLGRTIAHPLEALLTFAGSLAPKAFFKQAFEALLSFEGGLGHNVTHPLQASLEPEGRLNRLVTHTLEATLETVGNLPSVTTHTLAAAVSFAGELQRNTTHRLQASLEPVTRLFQTPVIAFQAALSFATETVHVILHPLQARLMFKGLLLPDNRIVQVFEATLSFAGNLAPPTVIHQLRATLSPHAQFTKIVHLSPFEATLTTLARLRPLTIVVPLRANLESAASLAISVTHRFRASLTPTVRLNKIIFPNAFAATLDLAARMRTRTRIALQASLEFAGSIAPKRFIIQRFEAFLGLTAKLKRPYAVKPHAFVINFDYGVDEVIFDHEGSTLVLKPQLRPDTVVNAQEPSTLIDSVPDAIFLDELQDVRELTFEQEEGVEEPTHFEDELTGYPLLRFKSAGNKFLRLFKLG